MKMKSLTIFLNHLMILTLLVRMIMRDHKELRLVDAISEALDLSLRNTTIW